MEVIYVASAKAELAAATEGQIVINMDAEELAVIWGYDSKEEMFECLDTREVSECARRWTEAWTAGGWMKEANFEIR